MHCGQMESMLNVYILHDERSPEYREMLSHLESCALCRTESEELRNTLSLLEDHLKPLSCPDDLPLKWDALHPSADEREKSGPIPGALPDASIRLTYRCDQSTETREFHEKVITIGRASDNTMPVPDQKSSRLHCCIEITPRGYVLSDHGSVNGTLLNSQRIPGPVVLKSGDVIEIGLTHITVEAIHGFASQAAAAPRPSGPAITLSYGVPPAQEKRTFHEPSVTIGRANDNVLSIHDQKISRFHSRIEAAPQGYVVSDLGSFNGTIVNGQRILEQALLKPGDVIVLGQIQITVDAIEGYPEPLAPPEPVPQPAALLERQRKAPVHVDRRAAPARTIRLTCQFGQTRETRAFGENVITIGRSFEGIWTIRDKKISRLHSTIEDGPQGYVLIDNGSVNGTILNGQRIAAPTPLKPGDRINIGFTQITVDAIEEAPVPVRPPVVKPSFRTTTYFEKTENTHRFLRIALPAAGVLFAAAVFLWLNRPSVSLKPSIGDTARSDQPSTADSSLTSIQILARDIDSLRKDVERSSAVAQSHLDRLHQIDLRVEGIVHGETHNEYDRRSQDLSRVILEKMEDMLSAELTRAERETGQALKDGNYASVFLRYFTLKSLIKHPFWEDSILDQISQVDRQYAEPDAQKLQQQEFMLKTGLKYKEARELVQKNLQRFRGTRHYDTLATELKEVQRLETAAAAVKPPVEAPKLPVKPPDPAPAPKLPPAPAPAPEPKAPEAPKLATAALTAMIDKADQLARSGKTLEAEALYKEVENRSDAPRDLADRARQKYQEVHAANAFYHTLIDGINAGKLASSKVRTPLGSSGTPTKADLTGITFIMGGSSKPVLWEKFTPGMITEMMSKLPLSGEALYDLAVYAMNNKLEKEARTTLQKYIGNDTGERRRKGSELIAKMKGLSNVPEGGFLYDPKTGDFVAARAKKEKDALAVVDKLAKDLSTSVDTAAMDKHFDQLHAMINDDALTDGLRTEIKNKTVDALKANQTNRMDRVKKNSGSAVNLDKLRDLKSQLNAARSEALRVIFDTGIYPDANHGKSGQARVDEVVEKVRKIWEGSGKLAVQGSPELNRQIEGIKKINETYLTRLGVPSDKNALDGLDEIVNNLVGSVNLKSYALNAEERKFIEYNQKVEKHNQQLSGVPDDAKAQVRVTNDYREMMGRTRLFIDARLYQAAQYHTENQAKERKIWHNGSDGTPASRLKKFNVPSSGAGENVLVGSTTPEQAHLQWYNSSGHHRNILGKLWNAMGAGHVDRYWTQNFAYFRQSPVN